MADAPRAGAAGTGPHPQVVVLEDMVDSDNEWEDDDEGDEEEAPPPKGPAWVPYAERPDWADVTPIPQNDGPFSIVKIAYAEEVRSTMDYFRAVLQSGEKSQRALDLTAEVVRFNPANYVGWWYRRQCLRAMQADLQQELDWVVHRLFQCLKNYQMWYHRRELLTLVPAPNVAREKRLIDRALADDAKNYHVWCHRRWLVQHFRAFEGELDWVALLIQLDVRNNSAWNYRFFLMECHQLQGLEPRARLDAVRRELTLAAGGILAVPNNESPYNYVLGLTRLLALPDTAVYLKDLVNTLSKVNSKHPDCSLSRGALLQCMDQLAELSGRHALLEPELAAWVGDKASNLKRALELARELQHLDGVRRKYWAFQQRRLEDALRACASPLAP